MSYRVARRILSQYERWATERDLVPDGEADRRRDRIGILIHGRADYLGKPDPTYWRSGDVHELLMQHCAARQVDAWDLAMYAPTEVRDFLRFLDETERLHPGSTRISTLLKELDRLTPKFAVAMADKSQWRLAKRVFTAMSADGVDPADQSAADLWAEKFSALNAKARRDVLGEMIDDDPRLGTGPVIVHEGQVAILASGQVPCKHPVWPDARCSCGECDGLDALPAITRPGKDELAEAVTGYGCGLLRRLVGFADWIGVQGRPVDKHGELMRAEVREAVSVFGMEPADATRLRELPRLSRLWRLSLEFGLLELRRTHVMPGPDRNLADRVLRGDADPDEALALWRGIFDEVSLPVEGDGDGDDLLQGWTAIWPPRFLRRLHVCSPHGEFLGLEEVMDSLLNEHPARMPGSLEREVLTEMAYLVVRMAISQLAEHGGVEVSGGLDNAAAVPLSGDVTAAIRSVGFEPWALFPAPGTEVRLTDLGRYAMREQLLPKEETVTLAEPATAG